MESGSVADSLLLWIVAAAGVGVVFVVVAFDAAAAVGVVVVDTLGDGAGGGPCCRAAYSCNSRNVCRMTGSNSLRDT